MESVDATDTPEKDLPLRDDIRLLGRILGDTVREQQGEAVFEVVERIRQTSIRFHRSEDDAARRELEATLNSLSRGQAIDIIRAYSFFLAPGQHRRGPASHPSHPGACLRRFGAARRAPWPMRWRGPRGRSVPRRAAGIFRHGQVAPVLTAHPTEVRRKSTIDREMEVAELLAERDRIALTPEEAAPMRRRCAAPC